MIRIDPETKAKLERLAELRRLLSREGNDELHGELIDLNREMIGATKEVFDLMLAADLLSSGKSTS